MRLALPERRDHFCQAAGGIHNGDSVDVL